jgi:hypothetical protein
VVIQVLAEQATVQGDSAAPGYLPGFGILSADSVRELAQSAHHLLKTFWAGAGGWADQQLPDGTIL